MRFEKRVPGLYTMAIDQDFDAARIASNETVKYHAEMAVEPFKIGEQRRSVRPVVESRSPACTMRSGSRPNAGSTGIF
jgi:hypothetical protein